MASANIKAMQLHSAEEFHTWLANDLEVRDELYGIIGEELGPDDGSLDKLESFLLHRYASKDNALSLSERNVIDAAARHVGLVMLLNIDGTSWAIDLNDADNAYYRLPIIRMSDDAEECPLALVTASIDRRSGSYLRGVVENYKEQYNDTWKSKD